VWVATLFDPPMTRDEWSEGLPSIQSAGVVSVCGQLEMCPSTGRPHAQLALRTRQQNLHQLRIRLRLTILKNASLKASDGKAGEWGRVATYATKEDTRAAVGWQLRWSAQRADTVEWRDGDDRYLGAGSADGDPSVSLAAGRACGAAAARTPSLDGAGTASRGEKRSREEWRDMIVAEISDGTSLWDLLQKVPVKEMAVAKTLAEAYAKRPRPDAPMRGDSLQLEFHFGITGAGKSHYARSLPQVECYWRTCSAADTFWDGYNGQSILVLDDLNGPESFPATTLLRVLDSGPLWLNQKYGGRYAAWTRVVMTSNLSPAELCQKFYKDTAVETALLRRLTGRLPDGTQLETPNVVVIHYEEAFKVTARAVQQNEVVCDPPPPPPPPPAASIDVMCVDSD